MAQIINLTRKEYNESDLVNVPFSINAENINTIDDANPEGSWEQSIITMDNGQTIYALETRASIESLIND
ncbi:MAG: hypothetical protein DSZ27_04820 [Thiomicrospira sp.]|nr:MAG: hypothetical protein DSZ27_04820 [Thiomicrospira sp.]